MHTRRCSNNRNLEACRFRLKKKNSISHQKNQVYDNFAKIFLCLGELVTSMRRGLHRAVLRRCCNYLRGGEGVTWLCLSSMPISCCGRRSVMKVVMVHGAGQGPLCTSLPNEDAYIGVCKRSSRKKNSISHQKIRATDKKIVSQGGQTNG